MNVAVLGLGIIGEQWAHHLHSDGILAACWNRSPKPDLPLFDHDLNKIPSTAEILHICVADPAAVESLLTEILPKLKSEHLVIQSSTIDPDSSLKFKTLVEKTGASYLEAPFTGSLPAAKQRELIFYIGGESNSLERAQPYLKHLSKKIVVIGNERQAATLKLVMNLQIASVMQAMAEALSIARNANISDEVFFEAFKLNASYSGVAALKEPKLKTNDFSAQFSTKHMAKDLRLLMAANSSVNSPFLRELQAVFLKAQEEGFSEEDFSSLIKLC